MAQRQELRDSYGRIIGYIEESYGKLVGKDGSFRIKGYYDPRNNETRNTSGYLVGRGNLLALVICVP